MMLPPNADGAAEYEKFLESLDYQRGRLAALREVRNIQREIEDSPCSWNEAWFYLRIRIDAMIAEEGKR